MKLKYCWTGGFSSPIWARNCARLSGVASGPRASWAGSPGTRRGTANARTEMSRSVTAAWRSRDQPKLTMSRLPKPAGDAAFPHHGRAILATCHTLPEDLPNRWALSPLLPLQTHEDVRATRQTSSRCAPSETIRCPDIAPRNRCQKSPAGMNRCDACRWLNREPDAQRPPS